MKFLLFSPQAMLGAAAGVSLLVLGVVWAMQYGFALHPCHLCLLERWPYIAASCAGLAGYCARGGRWKTRALAVCALAFILGTGIAAYHTGVEYHWFPGPSSCTDTPPADDSLESLRAQIRNAPLVACDQAVLRVLGLSLAAWNAMVSACLAAACIAALLRIRNAYA